jgi:hypothetical protein
MNAYLRARQAAVRARLYATDAQRDYLRRLLDEAFANHHGTGGTHLDRNHLERVTKAEASEAISKLLAAKRDNWGRTDVFSKTTSRLIGTVKRRGDDAFGAYSYARRDGETFKTLKTLEAAVAWIEAAP